MTYRDAGAQGALITTSNSTDISISGRGMIPVTDIDGAFSASGDRQLMLTSTGSFFTDENGLLRTQSGLFLLGWPADSSGSVGSPARDSSAALEPVRINLNQFSASPTTAIRLGLNLPASDTVAGSSGASYSLPIEYFDNLGRAQTLNLSFTPTVPATGSSNAWSVSIIDNAGDPLTPIADFGVTFDTTAAAGGSVANVTPGAGAQVNLD